MACAFTVLVGCAQFDTGSAARRRVAELLDCDEEELSVSEVAAHRYRGEGCGGTAEVVCTAAALEPTCVRQRISSTAGAESYDDDELAREPDASPDGEAREGSRAGVEARIRSGLDARREDILACVGSERVAVRVAYEPDGRVQVSLQGPLAGSAEEGCLRAALTGVRVAASGAPGVVVHLVR